MSSLESVPDMINDLLESSLNNDAGKMASLLYRLDLACTENSHKYGLFSALAATGKRSILFLGDAEGPDTQAQITFERVDPEGPEDPARSFALKFLAAHVNNSPVDVRQALFQKVLDASNEEYCASLLNLLGDVTGWLRLAMDKATEEGQ